MKRKEKYEYITLDPRVVRALDVLLETPYAKKMHMFKRRYHYTCV
jgi:hypothetical protein